MLSTLHNFMFKVKVRKNLWFQSFQKCTTVTGGNIEDDTETKLIVEKHNEILQLVNSSTLRQLTKYIQLPLAKSIISYRTTNGPYSSLDDMLLKNEMEPDVLNQFYALVTDRKMQQKKWKKYVVMPDIKTIPIPETAVGIHVGPTAITWALVSSDSKILDWNCFAWHDGRTKISTYDLINLASSVVQEVPLSSCYVMEEFQIGRKSLRNIVCTQQQLTISLMSCLRLMEQQKLDNSLSKTSNVYLLQPLTSARLFNLTVGNEIIATRYAINDILNYTEKNDAKLKHISIDNEVRTKYMERNADEKEQMGWSLLKALAFCRLLALFNTNMQYKQSCV